MYQYVSLIGNLGHDPDLSHTSKGRAVATLSVATNRTFGVNDGNGHSEMKTETTWHRVIVWGQPGEAIAKHLSKGRQIHVVGRIENRSYDDDDGTTRYVSEIIADKVNWLGKPPSLREDPQGESNDGR